MLECSIPLENLFQIGILYVYISSAFICLHRKGNHLLRCTVLHLWLERHVSLGGRRMRQYNRFILKPLSQDLNSFLELLITSVEGHSWVVVNCNIRLDSLLFNTQTPSKVIVVGSNFRSCCNSTIDLATSPSENEPKWQK